MKIHPVCDVLPPMSASDREALKADIKANGVRVPVYVYKGFLVDGKHRWTICEELGIDCPTQELVLPEGASLVEHCVSINLRRRHLTQAQKAQITTDMLPLLEKEAAARKRANLVQKSKTAIGANPPDGAHAPHRETSPNVGKSSKRAADAVGVSETSVKVAKRIKQAAPDVAERVKAGELSLRAAEKEIAKREAAAHPEPDEAEYPADEWFGDVINRLHAIKREIVAHADEPTGRMIHAQAAQTDVGNIVRMLRGAEPAGKCPYCRADPTNTMNSCRACKGTHWLSRSQMDAVPKEMLS